MPQHGNINAVDFTIALLDRMRLRARRFREGEKIERFDHGLRAMLNLREDYRQTFLRPLQTVPDSTLLFLTDHFRCNYILLRLPQKGEGMIVGPYLGSDLSPEEVMELAETHVLPAQGYSLLRQYFAGLPVVVDSAPLHAIVKTLGETLWGKEMDTQTILFAPKSPPSPPAPPEGIQPDVLHHMKSLENRYEYENQLMNIVSKGLIPQAESALQGISQLNFASRHPDPLRNLKNYGIVLNTLLRKAAEQGGVHPIHLDRTSDHFARALENLSSQENSQALFAKMIATYTRLVKTNAIGHYSPQVQKALTYVEANLSGDLSLSNLSRQLNLSPGYLSALFHRETGTPLNSHVNKRRMETAAQLLQSTRLLVQTIAQHCGITDTNYFSRLFKKHYGKTPKQYREGQ